MSPECYQNRESDMLGIDVNEIQEVTIDDAVFKVGIIPYGVKIRLDSMTVKLAEYSKTEKDIENTIKNNAEGFMNHSAESVKFGIKGHLGIKDAKNNEILFESTIENGIEVVASKTMTLYYHLGLMPKLSMEVFKINSVTRTEQKN